MLHFNFFHAFAGLSRFTDYFGLDLAQNRDSLDLIGLYNHMAFFPVISFYFYLFLGSIFQFSQTSRPL